MAQRAPPALVAKALVPSRRQPPSIRSAYVPKRVVSPGARGELLAREGANAGHQIEAIGREVEVGDGVGAGARGDRFNRQATPPEAAATLSSSSACQPRIRPGTSAGIGSPVIRWNWLM